MYKSKGQCLLPKNDKRPEEKWQANFVGCYEGGQGKGQNKRGRIQNNKQFGCGEGEWEGDSEETQVDFVCVGECETEEVDKCAIR